MLHGSNKKLVYVIGSLKNPAIPPIANSIRKAGFDVFDDWFAAGPEADDEWQKYELIRGRTYREALEGHHARQVFDFDTYFLDRADIVVLVNPSGKSAHLEFGHEVGRGKKGYVLFCEDPARYDVMYRYADGVFFELEDLIGCLKSRL